MVKQLEVLVIIPARGGSKGIPRKNIKDFAGYPLIAYSIVAAKQSALTTRIIVSTDDSEIAAISRQWGAEVPFFRPPEHSQDNTPDYPVVRHVLDWLAENEGYQPDVVVQLRPTSPVRPKDCIDKAVHLLIDHPDADCVRGVVSAAQNPFKMWTLNSETGQMIPLVGVEGIKEAYNAPRQILPDVYWQTGHIDAIRTKTILEKSSLTGDVIYPLIIDPSYTVDIDVPADWKVSEQLVKQGNLDFTDPASKRRQFPSKISLIAMDFDGVLTDDRVWVNQDGEESVAASRSDGLGIRMIRELTEIHFIVISSETNPVVDARCKKLKIPVVQSVKDKSQILRDYIQEKEIDPASVIYVGNDVNDLSVFDVAGFTIAPVDAYPEVIRRADLVLTHKGGHGAIRELCDMILSHSELDA